MSNCLGCFYLYECDRKCLPLFLCFSITSHVQYSPCSAMPHDGITERVSRLKPHTQCSFNSSNIRILGKWKTIQCVERIPYQRLFPFGYILWRLAYLLYGSVASLPSPTSNIEAWPYGTSLRFAPAFRALGVCEHTWLRYRNFECSNLIGRNQFIPLRHIMLAKLIRVRRIEQSPTPTLGYTVI